MSIELAVHPPHQQHACTLFATPDEEYRGLLPFVREGFARGERAYHLVDPELVDDHLRHLERAHVDVVAARGRGELVVRGWDDVYLPRGYFDEDTTVAAIESILQEGRSLGFPRTRLIGFGCGSLLAGPDGEAMVRYESRINHMFARWPDPVVCSYQRGTFGLASALDLVCAHPAQLRAGAFCENAAFVPPQRFVAARRRGDHVAVLRERYLAAILAGSERDALDVVVDEGLWLDVPVPRLYEDVVKATLHEVGRLWEAKRVGAAYAHVANEVSRQALAQLRSHLRAEPDNGRRAVVACVEGERHDLGARMVTDLLEAAGFEVSFLGAAVPTEMLVAFLRDRPPHALALSATATASIAALRGAVAAVREVLGSGIALAAGGQIFAAVPGLGGELALDVHTPTAAGAVAALRRLHAR